MKQLLQTLGSHHMVAGLHNRAYLVTGTGSDDNGDCKVVLELLPPNVPLEQDYEHRDANEVQAVAIMSNKQEIWCAVSRMNKTLSLYCFTTTTTTPEMTQMDPRTVHKTTKRVCCMDFAQVPNSKDGLTPLNVIIAGDLTGDATAYPLILNDSTKKDSPPSSHVLLGHTASVLTGVKVVSDKNGLTKILTSDRDEKIRVSRFPQTYIVEGYLLGHTAFVAAMDVLPETNRCVTCSGDGTLRLWNYNTCQELAVAQLPTTKEVNNDYANKATRNDVEDKDKDEQEALVPTRISMSRRTNGEYVAVIFDKCTTVHLYRIVSSDESSEIQPCQELECPSQPLAIQFVKDTLYVLVGEPDYCLAFTLTDGTFEKVQESSCCCKALRQVALTEKIEMPTSLMETDRKGRARIKVKPHEDRINQKPWNNVERKQIAKKANARRHKRKRLEKQK